MLKFNTNPRIKYTKENISDIAHSFMDNLSKEGLAQDVAVYFNGIRYSSYGTPVSEDSWERTFCFYQDFTKDGVGKYDPNDYFDSVPEKHIMSVSFEGPLYNTLNGQNGQPYWMYKFFKR